ncbi:CDP-alcohol phosphatidyltransferase family protein [Fluviicola sp.]|uniref:CDP-alcohol phosphatidyltransferase family protein n=1 Tax=Fluviicola sp. TaxID=1917219 RepID=UPI00260A35D3|nr:CDP-alcohol phosphatidyltransferase family protein [Fluviicola sp.]
MKKFIPISLIIFRLILAPIMIGLAFTFKDASRPFLLVLMYLGLISDILDGIIARKINVSTEKLRRFDSQTDMIFWVSIGICIWLLNPDLISRNKGSISIIFVLEGMCYLISFMKFGKETCTHAFLSKIWGITLLIGFTSLIGFNYAGIPFLIAIIFGLISHTDRILITLLLPRWTHDVPSFYHAYLIRKGIEFQRNKLLN